MESNHRLALRHEMLSKVDKGTATPRDQGPGAVYRGGLFAPCGFWLLYKQDYCI